MQMLYAMPEQYGCWPSTKTFIYVLHMLVCRRQYEAVHEVYASAPRLGVELNTCCFNILIKGLPSEFRDLSVRFVQDAEI
ncbi:hypothetical protein ZWY2020_013147 [Hordeum vulgare]|nr:hypothetical protein ZWY2020_013147 [Hordeum vulgare]